jgi:hypothetical protein
MRQKVKTYFLPPRKTGTEYADMRNACQKLMLHVGRGEKQVLQWHNEKCGLRGRQKINPIFAGLSWV